MTTQKHGMHITESKENPKEWTSTIQPVDDPYKYFGVCVCVCFPLYY